ncbi:MAG: transcriptional repressor [Bacteroidales bacterium]|nr:transcriptional repressor [Bacteroidales bacterium]
MKLDQIRVFIKEKGLKITPQRIAVLEAVLELGNHPTAEKIIEFIQINHPNVAIGTVYKTLETFVENDIIKKVKTDKDIMRYDAILEKHHHLYCAESDRIEDYYDIELNTLLESYFKKKNIENFKIEDIKLQIIGNFLIK